MTLNKISQAGVEALFRVIPGLDVAQAGVEYLHRVIPGARTSQAGVEYLHRVQPGHAISQAGVELLYKAKPCGTREAQIWTITRLDGEVYRFTSLDRALVYPPGSGTSFRACSSLMPSASENVAEVDAAGTMDLSGAVVEDVAGAISAFDLFAGRLDGAKVEAWLVSWDPSLPTPAQRLLKGTFGPVELTESGFKVELVGDGAKLEQTPLVSLLSPDCRWTFGDPVTCQKDLGPLTVTGSVEHGAGVRDFTDSARTEIAGYFRRGRVTFTSGLNAGISAEIKEHRVGGLFELWPRVPYAMAAGDEYLMTPGCTNLKVSDGGCNGCTAWGQLLRYGGHDKAPTGDKAAKAADAR
jgi:uncharacterized phage protein (TIGR02218 family)